MPSLRQRMTTYFRQLSFIADPKENEENNRTIDSNCFITKYLEGKINEFTFHSDLNFGKEPSDLPDLMLRPYDTGPDTVTAACTGPDDGLTVVKRSRLHLSAGPDIDFIDVNQDQDIDIRIGSNTEQNIQKKQIRPRKSSKGVEQQKLINESIGQNENKNIYSYKNASAFKPSQFHHSSMKTKSSLKKSTSQLDSNDNAADVQTTKSNKDNQSTIANPTKNPIQPQVDLMDNILNGSNLTEQRQDNDTKTTCDKNSKNSEPEMEGNKIDLSSTKERSETIAGALNWKQDNDHAYGLAVSLYEKNIILGEKAGNPIADCYGLIVRGDSSALALADGVNWGEGARLAARSAVLGSLEYIDTAVFGQMPGGMATSTNEVFVSLLRSFWEAHDCILEVNGALSTLTVAVVLPLSEKNAEKYVVCACNVGDSLGYIYSKKNGVKEFTQGSHDITSMRDMRDALGALGPVHDNKPELSNLTLSMTIVESGDIIFLTSDGLSDNFDPVVGKFVEPYSPDAIKSAAAKSDRSSMPTPSSSSSSMSAPQKTARFEKKDQPIQLTKKTKPIVSTTNTKSANPKLKSLPPTGASVISIKAETSTGRSSPIRTKLPLTNNGVKRQKFIRSNTVIEPRMNTSRATSTTISIPKSSSGLPLVTAQQRQTLTLLRIEDLLSYGINNLLQPCQSAKHLCHILMNFATMITTAKRKMLEQRELFYRIITDHNGIRKEVELNRLQQRAARKRVVDSSMFISLPGKLDHASIVAVTVGIEFRPNNKRISRFEETDF